LNGVKAQKQTGEQEACAGTRLTGTAY